MLKVFGSASRSKRLSISLIAYFLGILIILISLYHYSAIPRATKLFDNQNINPPRYAYATFLSSRATDVPIEKDPYVTATRVLTYQLLHSSKTKTKQNIPLLVIVPPHIPDSVINLLTSEGATIKRVENLTPQSWEPQPARSTWIDQFTKLRIFEFVEYERILYMDNDMLITKCLDEIFNEDEIRTESITRNNSDQIVADEGPLPKRYVLAAAGDQEGAEGERPKSIHESSQLSAGFFVLKPSIEIFQYYNSVLQVGNNGRFDKKMMEMGLLNYAHRFTGNMPWTPLTPGKWNSNWPSWRDYERGAGSLHDKFWDHPDLDWIDRRLVDMWMNVKDEMYAFWAAGGKGL